MITEFHLNANELNEDFLKKLKSIFKNGERLSITIEEELDETEYLLKSDANREMLEKSIKNADSGNLTKVDIDKYFSGK